MTSAALTRPLALESRAERAKFRPTPAYRRTKARLAAVAAAAPAPPPPSRRAHRLAIAPPVDTDSAPVAARASRTRVAPVDTLPYELLSAIFELAAPADPRAALRLTHVAHRWRATGLRTAALWRTLRIAPATPRAFLAACLRRSRGARLDIAIAAASDVVAASADLAALAAAMDLLLPHLPRWRSYSVCTDVLAALGELVTPLHDRAAPALERLALLRPSFPGAHDLAVELRPAFLAGGAPQLRHVAMAHLRLPWDSPLLAGLASLELAHLTGPRLPPMSFDAFAALLARSPRLERLALRSTGPALPALTPAGGEPPDIAPLALPHLRALKLSDVSAGTYVPRLLALLDAPGVEQLDLSEMDILGFHAFTERLHAHPGAGAAHPAVRVLRLYNCCILPELDVRFFRAFPALESLSLFRAEGDPFFRVLQTQAAAQSRADADAAQGDAGLASPATSASSPATSTADASTATAPATAAAAATSAGPLWPNLARLEVRCMYNESALRATVASRLALGRPIRQLLLGACLQSRLGRDTMEWLRARTDVGVYEFDENQW